MIVPSAIIFVNKDLVDQVKNHLIKQLHIDEVIDGYVFDDRLLSNPNYITNIKQNKLRILVERSFLELENRTNADVVIFIKSGLASILKNNFGPPGNTYPVVNLYWGQLCIFTTAF